MHSRSSRYRALRALAAATLLLSRVIGAEAAMPPRFTPDLDTQILEPAPPRPERSTQFTAPTGRVADAESVAAYVRALIELGRANADPRYYGRAEAALSSWENAADAPPEIAWLQAVLAQQRHAFEAALLQLDRLLAREPDFAPALLTRAAILLVQGKPAESRRDCTRLAAQGLLSVATTCAAAATSLLGQAESALASLDAMAPTRHAAPAGEQVWALTLAAEIAARLGRDDDADRRFAEAIGVARELSYSAPYLRIAYADWLLDHGRPEAIAPLLETDSRVDAAQLRVAVAIRRRSAPINRPPPALEAIVGGLQQRFADARARGEIPHEREEAMLALWLRDDPQHALSLALSNWNTQREPVDARLVLEAALAAGRPAEAAPVLDWMRSTGVQDAVLQRLSAQLAAADSAS
jgi:hypothetical protein